MTFPSEPPAPEPRPTLVGAGLDGTAFLDAPGLDAAVLLDIVDRVLTDLPDGTILTVYADDSSIRTDAANWCADCDVQLLAVIGHEDGTTLALRRSGRSGRPGRPGLPATEATSRPDA